MKKILIVLLSVFLSVFILTGCNNNSSFTTGPSEASDTQAPFGPDASQATDQYSIYTPEAFDTAIAEGKQTIVFVGATRCGPCNILLDDVNQNISNIPQNVHLLIADFERNKELIETYEVYKKHTTLYFDTTGNVAKKSVGGEFSLQDLIDGIPPL